MGFSFFVQGRKIIWSKGIEQIVADIVEFQVRLYRKDFGLGEILQVFLVLNNSPKCDLRFSKR